MKKDPFDKILSHALQYIDLYILVVNPAHDVNRFIFKITNFHSKFSRLNLHRGNRYVPLFSNQNIGLFAYKITFQSNLDPIQLQF